MTHSLGAYSCTLVIFEKFYPDIVYYLKSILSLSNEHSDALMFDKDLQTLV